MKARGKKYTATIRSPTKGVATYYTQTGAYVFHAHWSADPLKDEAWADRLASNEPGGRQSVFWLQEFEADDEAKSGERVYWAFSSERNVIPRREIPIEWPVYLGADFGENAPTAVVFLAQDPKTKRIYVFDLIYTRKGLDPQVKELIYSKLCQHFGITMKQLMLDGASRWVAGAEGDKTAPAFISFYQMDPWAINFAGRDDLKQHKNRTTIPKVNRALWPSMMCCGVRHMADKVADTDDEPEHEKKCPLCNKVSEVYPIMYVLDGAATELVEQLEGLVNKEPQTEDFEAPDKQKDGQPNHATDGLKYITRAMEWEGSAGPTEDEQRRRELGNLESVPVYARTFQDSMRLMVARAAERAKEAEANAISRHRTIRASSLGRGRGILYANPVRPEVKA